MQKWMTWLGVPLGGVLAIMLAHWSLSAAAAAPERPKASLATATAPQTYVLEVIGLGVSLDKHRQGKLWDALQKGHPFATIREMDPNKYPYTSSDKLGYEGAADASALENGVGSLPMYWAAPSFYASGPFINPSSPVSDQNPPSGIVGGTDTNGLSLTLFVPAGYRLSDHPDRLLEEAFAFFDAHPDVPYLVVAANDGMYFRHLYRPKGSPRLIHDGHYVPEMPGAAALFVLARRERVDALRPFVFDDTSQDKLGPEQNRTGLARRIFLAHYDLSVELGKAKSKLLGREVYKRWPTVPEWLAETARFAKRPDVIGPQGLGRLNPFDGVVHTPKGYTPTPWFPIPWNTEQLAAFDRLPTLGYVHRPHYIPLTDADGKPLTRRSERIAALVKGWNQALAAFPEAQRPAALKRVISSTGGSPDKLTELTALLDAQAAGGGPELHLDKPSEWIDIDPRLGNTGSASLFMNMAIGVMGSYIDGGGSAAINLRNDREASLVFISPPPPDKLQRQSRAVFKNQVTPAIDPANYR
ncbi:type VI lipase adapter Tla3 domain-containing protein [Zoogloea sp.]|uniref:type VI lipase adapter Tla3 domain-containing protein n=1 Tax=Zoogloea sp. TaxID=49181 RepID=UPI002614D14D|nr:DUF2875 family protein [uncultured Zoogloea sp.]